MSKKIIHLIIAARPNIMKMAPLYHALAAKDWADVRLIHTGQHYDDTMSDAFFRDLALPAPQRHLGIRGESHAEQVGKTMVAYEDLILCERPDLVVVAGDVNATIACALAAKKLNIAVAHMEAGLRSFDRTMPEEINRIATDCICDWYWTPSFDATAQLIKEGVAPDKIGEVGNIMIDAYCLVEDKIKTDTTRDDMKLDGAYAVATLHRPVNVDAKENLEKIISVMEGIAATVPVIFPIHPRTQKHLQEYGLYDRLTSIANLHVCAPLPYIKFMNLVRGARLIVTDSGGVQEETSYLGIPCLTLRPTTERPITITEGTNALVNFDSLPSAIKAVLQAPMPERPSIKGWDGKAAGRTVAHIAKIFRLKE